MVDSATPLHSQPQSETEPGSVLSLHNVSKTYGAFTAVDELCLSIEKGSIYGFLGPNGAGKTTLLRVLHGVERLSSGELALSKPDAQARQEQAYVFQSPIMLRRTVRANLAYPLELLGTARPIIKQKVEHWAERIGLADALERHAPRLSGGEKQKLALARANSLAGCAVSG